MTAEIVPCSEVHLGEATLHLLHTAMGRMFFMSEVAGQLFHENPGSFSKELRSGRYAKVHTESRGVLRAMSALGISPESHTVDGATLITPQVVEALLRDRHMMVLLQPFRLALLRLASQEAAQLMAAGDYEAALPVAVNAVKQGQAVYKPATSIQLFPLYLLAAQANLGLKRARQCEEFLGLASWLALKEPTLTTNLMQSQLSRLFGQLYAMEEKNKEAIQSFAEDIYYCSLEYGPRDVRTTLGYYNIAKIFESQEEKENCLAYLGQVVTVWVDTAQRIQQNGTGTESAQPTTDGPSTDALAPVLPESIPLGKAQLGEVVGMLEDACWQREEAFGAESVPVAEAYFAVGLVQGLVGDVQAAARGLEKAGSMYGALHEHEREQQVRAAMIRLFTMQSQTGT